VRSWRARILGRPPEREVEERSLRDLLPLPPLEMRELIGPTEPELFDQPEGEPVFPSVAPAQYASVLDFGCGCGRVARKLALAAAPMPSRYVGIDLHRGMVKWDNEHLAPLLPNFSFVHHDVFNAGFNPDPALPPTAQFPVDPDSVTLLIAWSVFTHLVQSHAEFYLNEVARVLRADGVAMTTWFLFDKAYFPMMQEFQNALYINLDDPTNAVIFDRDWLRQELASRGLCIRAAEPPEIRGFQWRLEITHGERSFVLPADEAPFGRKPPPLGPPDASSVGGT
jgi:SAM-dependent methyltransferase